jgi:hypothetical protein
MRPDQVASKRSELHMPRSELHTAAFKICDRNSLDRVAVNSHIGDSWNVLNQKPLWQALHDDPACVLQHLATVLNAVMIIFLAVTVRRTEPLTRRARHNSFERKLHAAKLPDVSASDLVRRLNDAETVRSECTVEKSDARDE